MPRFVWMSGIAHGLMVLGAIALTGCLEPNPHAAGADTGTTTASTTNTSASTSAGTSTDTGTPPPPADFAYEVLAFDAGQNGFSGSLPKPDQPNVVALAIVDDYGPRNAETLGYDIQLTDNGSSYDVSVTLDGGDPNSRVRGRAIALGFATVPDMQTIELTAADSCASAMVSGSATVDAVQAYSPTGGVELSYSRTATPSADGVMVEYCITAASNQDASLRATLIGFSPPDGVEAFATDDLVIDSQVPQGVSFPQIDANADVLQLVSVHGFDEAAANNLGYTITCATTTPFACSFDLSGFKAGAQIVAGGLTIAIP